MSSRTGSKIRCRQIGESDLDAVMRLLARGFPGRPRRYWANGLRRLGERVAPEGYPRYGYLLEADGIAVGCVLVLCTTLAGGDETQTRCNLSSWYVEPEFRSHASSLIFFALRHKQATYVNVTPARHTWPTVEAQGFKRYCSGLFFAVPALSRSAETVTVRQIGASAPPPDLAAMPEIELLTAHAGYDCLSLVCSAADGDHPFIFNPFRIRSGRIPLPGMRLVYCREVAEFVRFAGPLGRFLLRRGKPCVVLDSNGHVDGLAGLYTAAKGRKYFKGAHSPRLGDLAGTELVLFGP
jgi:hypothetical protein